MNITIEAQQAHTAMLAYLEHARQAVHFKLEYERHLPFNGSWIQDCLLLGLHERMKCEAQQAGGQFATYVASLGCLSDDPIELYGVPEELDADPELLRLFRTGFEQQKVYLGAG